LFAFLQNGQGRYDAESLVTTHRTLFAKILLPLVSPPLQVGWDTALFAGKYSMFT
jgi:hypothetical protein